MKINNVILSKILSIIEEFALLVVLLSFFIMGCSSKFEGPNSLYSQQDYQGAINGYDEIFEESTKASEKAAATFNIAFSYFRLAEQTDDPKHEHYENAKVKFIQLVENFPDYRHMNIALFQVALIANRQGKSREAIDYALSFNRKFPDSEWVGETSFIIGRHYRHLRNYEAARNTFISIMKGSPKKEQADYAHYEIAKSFFQEEKYEQAYQEFDKLSRSAENPDLQMSAMHQAAICLVKLNEHNKALEVYSNIKKQFPESKSLDYVLLESGIIYNQLQNYSVAHRTFTDLLLEHPGSEFKDNAQYNIAMMFYNEAMYKEAYTEFRKFSSPEFKDYPDHQAEAMYYAALCLNHLGSYGAALNALGNLIRKFPESESVDDTFLVVGQVNFYQGNFEGAINAYQSLLKKDPDSDLAVLANLGIANSYFQSGKWIQSINTYESFISEYNDHKEVADVIPNCTYRIGEAYYKLATNQHKSGDIEKATINFEKALDQYQKTLDDFSTDKVALSALYGMMRALNDLDRKAELERLVSERGISESIDTMSVFTNIDLTGLSYFRLALTQEKLLKDYKNALESYKKAIPRLKNRLTRAQSYYQQGLIYQDKLNPPDLEKALEVFQILISEYSASGNPSLDSMVADANIRSSEILGKTISEEEKRSLIDQKVLGNTVHLIIKDSEGRRLGSGSGFFVGHGQIATNYHVVALGGAAGGHAELIENNTSIEENMRYDIQGYTALDVEHDLIILKVSGLSPPALPLGNSDTVKRSSQVCAVGTPLGDDDLKGTISRGTISNIKNESGKRTRLQMTCPVSPGNSGGPLVTASNGEVIGIVVSQRLYKDRVTHTERAQNINFAVPVNYLKTLIQKAGPPKPLLQVESLWQLE